MKVEVFENKKIKKLNDHITQNENNVTEIEIEVPEKYKDYNKKIVFAKKENDKEAIIAWDFIEDNRYKIRKNISKYESVDFYIWLTKGDEDFRSETSHLTFIRNQDASDQITEEEKGAVNKILKILEDEITKVTDLEEDVKKLINDINFKLKDEITKYAEEKKTELNEIAEGVKDMTTAIQFASFEVNNNMELVINTAEKLKNTNFSLNKKTGNLEVQING